MKTLLVSLLPTTENFGIKYIHSYLLSKGHDSTVLFLPQHTRKAADPLIDFVRTMGPRMVGCGFMSYEAPFAAFLGRRLKESFPDILFAAGGIHPTINPEECLEYADIVCMGECEDTLLELSDRIDSGRDYHDVENLAFREGDAVRKNPLRPYIEDLDRLPFPEHKPKHAYIYHDGRICTMDEALFRRYTRYDGKAFNIISSRGCPFSCSYCCNSFLSKMYGSKKLRKRTPQDFIQEMREVLEQFPDIILMNIHDDCFLAQDKEWHEEFVREYKKWINRPFIVRSTPLHLTDDKIAALREAGLAWVTMGLQSGSERTNRDVFFRRVDSEKFLDATRLCKKHKISGYYDVILDNPFESEEDVIETINVLKQVPKPHQLQLFSLTFYKGTDIYDMYHEKFGDENPDIQNYFGYRRTFLNKLVRITPLLPEKLVDYFVKNRARVLPRILFNIIYVFNTAILEPLSFFYLMLASFRNDLKMTFKIALPTFKTKIRERLISFKSDLD